jgi:hypothetical protein
MTLKPPIRPHLLKFPPLPNSDTLGLWLCRQGFQIQTIAGVNNREVSRKILGQFFSLSEEVDGDAVY